MSASSSDGEELASRMRVWRQATAADEVDVIVLTNEARPTPGKILVTAAAMGLLTKQNLQPGFFLGWHAMDQGNAIDLLVQSLSSDSLGDCSPIATRYEIQFGPIVVETEVCNDGVNRVKTRLSLPLEQ